VRGGTTQFLGGGNLGTDANNSSKMSPCTKSEKICEKKNSQHDYGVRNKTGVWGGGKVFYKGLKGILWVGGDAKGLKD